MPREFVILDWRCADVDHRNDLLCRIGKIDIAGVQTALRQNQDKGQVVVASWGGTAQDSLREAILKPLKEPRELRLSRRLSLRSRSFVR